MPHLILYDGDCGLCSRLVLFLLKRDKQAQFLFAPLGGLHALRLLNKYSKSTADTDSVVLVEEYVTECERVYLRSGAVLKMLQTMGGAWWCVGVIFGIFPLWFRDPVYVAIASRRRQWFGSSDSCPAPSPELSERFLD